nr:hypothetical protein CFP56_30825 [Quercus suber]
MATDAFLSESMRHRVLREIAVRAQRTMFDVCYSWYVQITLRNDVLTHLNRKYSSATSTEITSKVQAIITRLTSRVDVQSRYQGCLDDGRPSQLQDEENFFAVTVGDFISVVKTLCPQRRPVLFTFDGDSSSSGLHSSSSSISGFSLFQNTSTSHASFHPAGAPRNGSCEQTQDMPGSGDVLNALDTAPRSSWIESHGESLREACAAIEELGGGYGKSSGSWIMLLMKDGCHPMATTLEEIEKLSNGTFDQIRAKIVSTDRHRCAKAIEDLLMTRYLSNAVDWRHRDMPSHSVPDLHQALLEGFQYHLDGAEEQDDFLEAYSWSQKLRDFQRVIDKKDNQVLQSVVKDIERSALVHMSSSRAVTDACGRWIGLLDPILELGIEAITAMVDVTCHMRNKIWFVTDVRTSAPYEAARAVANALRIMAKPKRQQRLQTSPPLRHWNAAKAANGQLHLKSDVQVLELLSATPLQGGPNKLGDDQSKATAHWMECNNIENLCQGEECLHRLCMEIRKCIEQLISTTLWNAPLFAHDKTHDATSMSTSLANLQGTVAERRPLTLKTHVPPSVESISTASHPLSSTSSRDYFGAASSAPTRRSSVAFWSPTTTEPRPPSSATSVGSLPTQYDVRGSIRERRQSGSAQRIDRLRRDLTSLLLSDIASPLFAAGSETDRAYWTGIGGEVSERHLRALQRTVDHDLFADPTQKTPEQIFDFGNAFTSLLRRFSATKNPYSKLEILHEVDRLISLRALGQDAQASPSTRVIPDLLASSRKHITLQTVDANVAGFRTLFCNSNVRPTGIFRDLQYIAALVPPMLLETTPQGKAFWNAGVALLGLKQELRTVMVETADSIIAYHSNNRGHGRTASTAQLERDSATFSTPSRTPSAEDVARYSMSDAACLLQITAREGDRVAQRELATLYLTHPELMDHIIAPFARPRDVFREELENKWRRNQDPNRCDPMTMCVAHHWMSLSSKAGDSLAKEFLKQREELSDF